MRLQIIRLYWSFPRGADLSFHREILIRRPDGLTVVIRPLGDRYRVFAAGSVSRLRQDRQTLRSALAYGAQIARVASPDLWTSGARARRAESQFQAAA